LLKSSRLATAVGAGLLVALATAASGYGGISQNDPVVVHAVTTQIRRSTVLHWERAIRLGAVSAPGTSDRTRAIGYLISGNWAIEEAAKEGLAASPDVVKQWTDERLYARSQSLLDAEKELPEKGQDIQDVEFEAKVALSVARLRERAWNDVPISSQAEVRGYYEHHRKLFFHESRATYLNEKSRTRSSAIALAGKLGTGRRFTQRAIFELVTEAFRAKKERQGAGDLARAIFAAQAHRPGGPVLYDRKWVIFVVTHIDRESLSLAAVSDEIGARLRSAHQLQALEAFASRYRREWSARTICGTGFVAPGCSESQTGLSPAVNSIAE
jgi:hypothetical protein